MIKVNILDHPLIQHKLTQIRQKETSTTQFRQMINEIGGLMVYEITRDLPLEQIEIETPVAKTKANVIAGKKMVVVPILRAGLGMVDGILQMIPSARIGHIGIFRDEVFEKLGGKIVCHHLKDLVLLPGTTVRFEEVPVTEGILDIDYYVQKINADNPDVPVLLEHLPCGEAYQKSMKVLNKKFYGIE